MLADRHGDELLAVCLSAGPDHRVACLALTRSAGETLLVPLPTKDPLVAWPVPPVIGTGEEEVGATCGNCV